MNICLPAIIVIVAALVRLVYLAEIAHEPSFSHPLYDPEYNDHWARGIVTGDWTPPPGVNNLEITTTPHGRPPGYPWFLAAVYTLFGVNNYAPRLVQMGLGVINALLLYLIGKRLFGRAVGFMAGLFMATYWVFPYLEGILTYPVLAVFTAQCLILVHFRRRERLQLRWALIAGLVLGGFALAHINLGNALADHGATDRALLHFREAQHIAPGDAAPPYNITRVLFAQGKDDESAAYYKKAFELRPIFAESAKTGK